MKKSLVFGIVIFLTGAMMIGCGKSSKSASSPTPAANDTTANATTVANAFGATSGTSTDSADIVGRTVVVSDANAFSSLVGYNNSSNGALNFFNGGTSTGSTVLDGIGNCVAGIGLSFGLQSLANWLNVGNNSQFSFDGSCGSGTNNGFTGNNGSQGFVIQNGSSFPFSGTITSTNFRGSISVTSAGIFSFDGAKTVWQGRNVYYDSARRLLLAIDGQNAIGLFYNNGTQQSPSFVKAGTVTL